MHSKVIIASLACVLAASFNCDRGIAPVAAENNEAVAKETISRAPNDYQKNYWFSEQEGDSGYQFTVTVDFEKEYQSFQILSNEDDVDVVSYSFYGTYASITIEAPTDSGEHTIKFGYRSGSKSIVLTSIYIYVKDGNYAASAYSMDDAKSRLFRYQESSYDVLDKISYRDEVNFKYGHYSAYDPSKYYAEQRHANYVYGGRDYDYDFITFPSNNSSYTKLILHAVWIDKDGNDHPLAGVRADFMTQCSLLGQGDLHFTDGDGKYVVDVPLSQSSGLNVNDVRCRLSAVCEATAVEDSYYQNYPLCYTLPYGTPLSNYFELDLFLYVFADYSDRGGAYEITQAQSVPYNYVDTFAETLDTTITRFPSAHTDYVSNRYYNYIDIQKEDVHGWDVISHEYGHFICNQLGLCEVDSNRHPHNVHTNLGEDGIELAYSEGLATYLGLAAQMYYADSIDIAGFGDELYQDTYRDLVVYYDRFAPSYGGSGRMYGERYETSTTAMMIKMLDDVSRYDDNVALDHAGMWNILLESADCYCRNIVEFIDVAVDMYPSYTSAIRYMQEIEMIAEYLISPYNKAEWTIMMYICGANLQTYALADIAEVLKVAGQPSNVNIIMEIGGSTSWGSNSYGLSASNLNRYHVRNKSLISDGKIANANMGAQSTFEDFMNWGLRNYPARKTGVILWNHGGALNGCCYDYNYSHNPLTSNEMYYALDNSFYKNRVSGKLEFLGYDACLMQVQDVAEYNSKYFNYMVASEELEPASGWAYDKWVDNLYAKQSTTSILTEIVNTYISNTSSNKATLSAIDLSKMSSYRSEFEGLASQIKSTAKSNWTTFKNILTSCKAFDYDDPRSYGTIDGYDFLNKLYNNNTFASYRTKINTVKTKYNQLFVARNKKSGAGEAYGLAIFCAINDYGNSMTYQSSATHFSNWRSVVI